MIRLTLIRLTIIRLLTKEFGELCDEEYFYEIIYRLSIIIKREIRNVISFIRIERNSINNIVNKELRRLKI